MTLHGRNTLEQEASGGVRRCQRSYSLQSSSAIEKRVSIACG